MDKPPDDPRWCPMLEAIELRTAQLGDRDLAILDLEQAIESGKLRGMRWSCATGESRLTAPFRELFAWVNGYAYGDWLYSVWKPDFERLFPAGAPADQDDDSYSKAPPRARVRDQVKRVLHHLYGGSPPPTLTLKAITEAVADEFERRGRKPPSPDTVARALGRRRDRQ
jgi:hypothetical protein